MLSLWGHQSKCLLCGDFTLTCKVIPFLESLCEGWPYLIRDLVWLYFPLPLDWLGVLLYITDGETELKTLVIKIQTQWEQIFYVNLGQCGEMSTLVPYHKENKQLCTWLKARAQRMQQHSEKGFLMLDFDLILHWQTNLKNSSKTSLLFA